ncbi:MAG TPA: PIN domain nuclease [Burkholderiales bacterium]|nr:PIN domain nuclease [Burkholderiales bacterium]
MILVDSSVWIEHFQDARSDESDWLRNALAGGGPKLAVGDLILAEVLQGFRAASQLKTATAAFEALDCVALGGRQRAIRAAENYRLLRSKGVTVRSTIDCLIATFCIDEGVPLLHDDRDFDPFEKHLGLRVVR